MKTPTAFALLLALVVSPARADDENASATLRGEIELLEIARDVDRTLFREALIELGHAEMTGNSGRLASEDAKKQYESRLAALREFSNVKAVAVLRRTAELEKKTAELAAATRKVNRPDRETKPDDKDREALIEKAEEAQIEVDLLQIQWQTYKSLLNQALNSLASAEFAARNDEARRGEADAGRKTFNAAKAKYLDLSKTLRTEQGKLAELRNRVGMGGMGGGFR